MTEADYTTATEMAGEDISVEALCRVMDRYCWAGDFVDGMDTIEVGCGTGPGLGYLLGRAKTLRAGDVSWEMLRRVLDHYGERVDVRQMHAEEMPFADNSADVVIVFEALYFLLSAERFIAECWRVLRPGGVVLVSNPNKDLYDFNPSAYSSVYHGVVELADIFGAQGFRTQFWGSTPLASVGIKQKLLRPVKKIAVSLDMIPQTMAGKRFLKRLIFGRLVAMPAEITDSMLSDMKERILSVVCRTQLSEVAPCRDFKVIYCAAWTSKDIVR